MRLHPDVVSTDTDDGTVLLNERTGRYWQLNGTGAEVLRRILDGAAPDLIAAEIAARHRIDASRAERDIAAVLDQLKTANLVIA
ncbi:lasso peptide biosynthesis PqqD family chaperone [Streptomyces sp. NPDC020742]|uniref:lasso peptide biosynthesis PqqD family chaperone n=1 Tax=unclassified Streptomyces TaxID=2593676 RepID=UPI0033E49396